MTRLVTAAGMAALFRKFQELKRVKRTGWIDRGMAANEVESVADHSVLTALIAWIASRDDPALDAERVLKLALIHDLAEAIVGDAPPYEPEDVPDQANADALRDFFSVRHVRTVENKRAKQAAERAAFADLAQLMPPGARAELGPLWDEYQSQTTAEAKFVKQVDRLEAYLQSRHYARQYPNLPLQGFTDMANHEIDHPALTAIRDASGGHEVLPCESRLGEDFVSH